MTNNQYDKQDCIDALREARDKLGESPSAIQYREMNIYPTYSTFYEVFGSWNEAKDAAGLETYNGRRMYDVPDLVEYSDEEWENLSPGKRKYIRDKCFLAERKLDSGCHICGYDKHPSALDFHHIDPNKKEFEVSQFVRNRNKEDSIKEIEKCKIICSNCHREKENDWFNVE